VVRVTASGSTTLLSGIDPTANGGVSFSKTDYSSTKAGFSMVLTADASPTLYIAYTTASKTVTAMTNAFTRSPSDSTFSFGGSTVYPSHLALLNGVVYAASGGTVYKTCEPS
jgi:hypothetical protein